MHPGQQLLSARVQLGVSQGVLRAAHWRIYREDHAALRRALDVGEFLFGIPLRVSDDPGLLGAGPLLVAEEAE